MNTKFTGFAKFLFDENLLSFDVLVKSQKEAQQNNISLVAHLLQAKTLNEKLLAINIAKYFDLEFLSLDNFILDDFSLEVFDDAFLRKHKILLLKERKGRLRIAIADPTDFAAIDAVKFHAPLDLQFVIVEYSKLEHWWQVLLSLKNSERTENKSIIELVDRLLSEAIDEKASDIHFEPMPDEYRIRFRIDGILYNRNHLKSSLALQVVSRLKVISKLDIAERRLPQDGRFTIYGKNNEKYDCRISSCPTFFGEKIVVRIPSVTNCLLSFSALGMNEQQKLLFEQYIHKPQGMIIVTGPTGSGKTLTLLSALSVLNVEAKNISTAEDPIELNLPGINQVEVNTKIGLTFSSLLRAFLRQDPDIIMLGEIRDLEAAEIAVQAAETGHLVLSTLHTNSAAEAVSRLLNMGIVPMNIANSVILIIAQRLVRKLCESCKQPEESAAFLLHRFDTSLNFTECPPIFRAVGCKRCKNGYLGRVGVFEILPISKNISYMIMQNKNAADILQEACSLGMLTLKNAALKKVFAGVTSIDEVARVIMQ